MTLQSFPHHHPRVKYKVGIQDSQSECGRSIKCNVKTFGGLFGAFSVVHHKSVEPSDPHLVREPKISSWTSLKWYKLYYLSWLKKNRYFVSVEHKFPKKIWLKIVSKINSVIKTNWQVGWFSPANVIHSQWMLWLCTVAISRDVSLSCFGSDETSQRVRVQGLQEPSNREGKTGVVKGQDIFFLSVDRPRRS